MHPGRTKMKVVRWMFYLDVRPCEDRQTPKIESEDEYEIGILTFFESIIPGRNYAFYKKRT